MTAGRASQPGSTRHDAVAHAQPIDGLHVEPQQSKQEYDIEFR